MRIRIMEIIFVFSLLAVAGCSIRDNIGDHTQIANPASQHCIEQGGTLDIVDTEEGQIGMCKLPSGEVCEEWAYFNEECPENIEISNFEECVAAGNPIMESYPSKCEAEGQVFVEELSRKEECESLHEGKWLPEFNECEGIDEKKCDLMGGNFDQCESACRNDPDATVCTMQCVAVCSFNEEEEDTNLQQTCEGDGGKWLPEFNECEFISEDKCVETEGEFFPCESACRHTGADICTKQCVPVCKY